MKIIDNKKDFYDYVVGQYGIDKYVVLDRRKWQTIPYLIKICEFPFNWFFSTEPNSYIQNYHREIYEGHYSKFPFFINKNDYVGKLVGETKELVVELGFHRWIFCVERYVENGKIHINVIGSIDCEISKIDKPFNSVVSIYESYNFSENNFNKHLNVKNYYSYRNPVVVKDVILKDTFISKHIAAEQAYYSIYNYLLSEKEPVVIDTRSDLQKIDSHGFDRKTSFRKM